MTFEESAVLSVVFFLAGALAFVLVRLFAEAARRRGARVLSTFERADALGTGPIQGLRTRFEDDREVRRLLLLPSPDHGLEALRLLSWAASGVAIAAFLVLAGMDRAAFWPALGTLAAGFCLLEAGLAIRRKDRRRAVSTAIAAALLIVGVGLLGGWHR